jgi:hypothetical protein
MRRSAFTSLILACLIAVLRSSGASAHPGATVFTIQLGAPTSISIVVPADYGQPIDEIDVSNAAGFDLQSAQPPAGWKLTRTGDTLVFSAGLITPYGYAVFAIRGVAPTKGEFLFPVTTHSPDGSVMRYDGQPGTKNQGAIVYAGIIPHLPGKGGFPWLKVTGGGVAAVGVCGTALILLRRRRSGGADVLHAPGVPATTPEGRPTTPET